MQISKDEEARYNELCLMALDFARNDDVYELEKMIKAGLSVNLKSTKGDTLLMLASYNNSINCVRMLLEHGADVDRRNDRGQTPLAGACFKGHLDVVKELVGAGADVNANNGLGATPYTFAVMFGRSDVVRYLRSVDKNPGIFKRISAILFGKAKADIA